MFIASPYHKRTRQQRKLHSFDLAKDHIKDRIITDDGKWVDFGYGLYDDERRILNDKRVIDLLSNPKLINKQVVKGIDLTVNKGITDDSLKFIANNFPQLQRLRVSGCDLVTNAGIVAVAEKCDKLTHLSYSKCSKVTNVALEAIVSNLPLLKDLSASHCNISALPDDFGYKLKYLEKLHLSNNTIKTLPASITNLAGTCTHFDIDGNPLQDPPWGVARQGLKAITRYYTELDYGFQISNQQKIVLVGNEEVGKTSLLHALQGRSCPLTGKKDRTIYVDHSKVRIPREGRSNRPDILASFYDCGGQEEYASGQTPFLTGSALYLFAVSADDIEDKESYLRFVTLLLMRAPNAVVQLIITKKDLIKKSRNLETIGRDVLASIQKQINIYSGGRSKYHGKEKDPHMTLRLQSKIIYISVKANPKGARNKVFDKIKVIAADKSSDPPLLPTLGGKIPVRWGALFLLIDELRKAGFEGMTKDQKEKVFKDVEQKDKERRRMGEEELYNDLLRSGYNCSQKKEITQLKKDGRSVGAIWAKAVHCVSCGDLRDILQNRNHSDVGERTASKRGMVHCRMKELCSTYQEYCIFTGLKHNKEGGVNIIDAINFLETQGNVYIVGDLIFLGPEVIGELMAKLVDHFLKDRVLNEERIITKAVDDFLRNDSCEDSSNIENKVNTRRHLLDWLEKFVQVGEIHDPKVLRFLWRDVLLPSTTSADEYDSIVKMFVDSGVICNGSSALGQTPVPVVVYRLPSQPPQIETEWPESCPSEMDEVCIHIELPHDVPKSLAPTFAAKLRSMEGYCIHAWLNGCIVVCGRAEDRMTVRADLIILPHTDGGRHYLLLAVRSTATMVAKTSRVFKMMVEFMEEEKARRLPGLFFDVVIPCPGECKPSQKFPYDRKNTSSERFCRRCKKDISLNIPNIYNAEKNEAYDTRPSVVLDVDQKNSTTKAAIMTKLHQQPLKGNEIMINGVRIIIPPKVLPSVAKNALELALHVALNGIGEGTKAKGFMIVLASKDDYEDPNFGYGNEDNKFKGNNVFVKDWKQKQRFLVSSFVQDGAMIIDGATGRFQSDLFNFQLNTQDADQNGGLGHKTASAAGDCGCVAIKCSADDCLADGVGKGYLKVFSGTKEATKVPILKISHAKS